MQPVTAILFICLLNCFAESTDLVISYKGKLKLLKNANSQETSNLLLEDLPFGRSFGFPMALFYVENSKQLLLSDYDNIDIDIYAISLDKNETTPVVESVANTQIESIIYDPILQKLYWSDVMRYGIYSNVTAEKSTPQLLYDSGSMQPRSITMDSCNQVLYWSDRDKINPKITEFDLKTKTFRVVKASIENTFYHGITFDTYDQQLWWFETNGDESSKSSCKLIRNTLSGRTVYANIERCYPFAVTFDRDFLYWNDWARQTVVRVSKTNSSDLVDLISMPTDGIVRAYGIANVNRTDSFECDVALVRARAVSASASEGFSGETEEQQVAYSSAASQSNSFAFIMFPDQTTSLNDMKKMYNCLHRVQLAFLTICLILSTIAVCLVLKLYLKQMTKSSPRARTIEVDALPSCDVTKPVKKFKRFVPRIIASPNGPTNSSVDIETCCQMTLCDQPCERAISKGGRFSTNLKKPEDKLRLLDDSMA